jgi:hypothetical protein
MLKFFSTIAERWNSAGQATINWSDDPLAHPDIRCMTPREIADLVIPPEVHRLAPRLASSGAAGEINGRTIRTCLGAASIC